MPVNVILNAKGRDIVTASATDTVDAVAKLLAGKRIGAVVIVNAKGGIEGIVSERDIVRAIAQQGAAALKESVNAIMTKPVQTCGPTDSEASLMSLMTSKRIRHLPVVQDGKLCGMISIGDVVKFRIEAMERESEEMKAYIAQAG
jgi:CBS domain-containing protein